MFKRRKIIWFIATVVTVVIFFFTWGALDYYKFSKIAKSVGGLPWQDGGTITMVRQPCVLDTPAIAPVTCAVSCPLVTSAWGSACIGYIELDTTSQFGTIFIAAPIGFVYQGGGTMPVAGMQYIAGGASNAIPWVIGIPGSVASRWQKVVNWFDVIIAGFKSK